MISWLQICITEQQNFWVTVKDESEPSGFLVCVSKGQKLSLKGLNQSWLTAEWVSYKQEVKTVVCAGEASVWPFNPGP